MVVVVWVQQQQRRKKKKKALATIDTPNHLGTFSSFAGAGTAIREVIQWLLHSTLVAAGRRRPQELYREGAQLGGTQTASMFESPSAPGKCSAGTDAAVPCQPYAEPRGSVHWWGDDMG